MITTPFLRFDRSSIVQGYNFIGINSIAEAVNAETIDKETVRFGLEFFGASVFSTFLNFAPSVVATVHVELTEKEFGLRIWQEVGRKVYRQDVYTDVTARLRGFCKEYLGTDLPN